MMFVDDFLTLELRNLDMVFKMLWLQKQRSMTVYWKEFSMIGVGDTKVILHEDLIWEGWRSR